MSLSTGFIQREEDSRRPFAAHRPLEYGGSAIPVRQRRVGVIPSWPGLVWLVCGLASFGMAAPPARAQLSEIVLHNFVSPPKGAYPWAGVLLDSGGNLYGTAYSGGAANAGVVYKVSAGHETVLYNFTGGADGLGPNAGVIRDSAGNLYGTATYGGALGAGVVYKLDPSGQFTVLYSFGNGGTDGAAPQAGVVRDSAGNLYGTTVYGGAASQGAVYRLDTTGHETVLYSFTGGADGGNPYAGVIRDGAGNLYGTTLFGGTGGRGVVYKVDAAGHETVLYSFSGGDGGDPYAGVIRDSAGNLYGATRGGGAAGWGVVYKVDAAGNETVLYSFTGAADGGNPYAGVVRDAAGNLYGTAWQGGQAHAGVVYKLDPSGHQTVLYNFTGQPDGVNPYAGVIRDPSGNLYGTTTYGGASNSGTVYRVNAAGQETLRVSFPSAPDGYIPYAGVVRDSAGNFYGTTFDGGAVNSGIVYKLDASGRETVLYTFTGGADGGKPYAGVINSGGSLYGTTQYGGAAAANQGTVYKVSGGQETVLYSFTGGADGGQPHAGVIRDAAGNLYGTTTFGGAHGQGVVYKLDPAGNETVLHSFAGGTDGGYPWGGVIRDAAGNLYGVTTFGGTYGQGVVYMLDAAGNETVLYTFTGGADGGLPYAGLIRGSGGLYGTTYSGGTASWGVVYRVDLQGRETVLHSFTNFADGAHPTSGVIQDRAGNLYGTASSGGSAFRGVVYKLDTSGQETVLYNFAGGSDGGLPNAGVILDSAGNLYGTATQGGGRGGGVVFKLTAAAK